MFVKKHRWHSPRYPKSWSNWICFSHHMWDCKCEYTWDFIYWADTSFYCMCEFSVFWRVSCSTIKSTMLLNSFFCFTSSWFVQFFKWYAVDLHLHPLFSLYMLSKYHLPNLLVRLAFQKKKKNCLWDWRSDLCCNLIQATSITNMNSFRKL